MYNVTVNTRNKTHYFRGVEFLDLEFARSFTNERWVTVRGENVTGIFLASELVSIIMTATVSDKQPGDYDGSESEINSKPVSWTHNASSDDLKVVFPTKVF